MSKLESGAAGSPVTLDVTQRPRERLHISCEVHGVRSADVARSSEGGITILVSIIMSRVMATREKNLLMVSFFVILWLVLLSPQSFSSLITIYVCKVTHLF